MSVIRSDRFPLQSSVSRLLPLWPFVVVLLGSGVTFSTDLAAQCAETAPQGEGPYYLVGSPERSVLVVPGDGPLFTLHGRVLDTECQPIPNCWIDVWHTDMDGDYDTSSPDTPYRGHFYTDDNGAFVLETIIPGLYPGRTPHIHVKVQGANTPLLTTQLYFPDHPLNPTDILYDQDLEVTPIELLPSGDLVASFEFYVPSSCTAPTVAADPVSDTFPDGDVATLAIGATGTAPLTYQWRRDGVDLVEGPTGLGATILGATAETLTIVGFSTTEAGGYDCVISSGCGAAVSEIAELVVGPTQWFVRGDCSDDGGYDLSDAITLLEYVFSGGSRPNCLDACDSNDDGSLGVADAIVTLSFLFSAAAPPADPYPSCGGDLSVDTIGCYDASSCP